MTCVCSMEHAAPSWEQPHTSVHTRARAVHLSRFPCVRAAGEGLRHRISQSCGALLVLADRWGNYILSAGLLTRLKTAPPTKTHMGTLVGVLRRPVGVLGLHPAFLSATAQPRVSESSSPAPFLPCIQLELSCAPPCELLG